MAAPKYSSEQFVKFFFTDEAVSDRPIGWELALHTGSPGEGSQNEVSSYTYERSNISFSTEDKGGYWEASNTQDVTFPVADQGESYTVTHYTVRDIATDNSLAIGELPVPVVVAEGTVITFPAGRIKVRGV